jgi:hypothetical protein
MARIDRCCNSRFPNRRRPFSEPKVGGASSMHECRILRSYPGPRCQHSDPRCGRQRAPSRSDHSGMAAAEWWRRRVRLRGTETRAGTCAPGARKSAGCLRCRRNPRPRVTTAYVRSFGDYPKRAVRYYGRLASCTLLLLAIWRRSAARSRSPQYPSISASVRVRVPCQRDPVPFTGL